MTVKTLADPIAALPRHTITYRILNNYRANPIREREPASSREGASLSHDGVLRVIQSCSVPPRPRVRTRV